VVCQNENRKKIIKRHTTKYNAKTVLTPPVDRDIRRRKFSLRFKTSVNPTNFIQRLGTILKSEKISNTH
jgi:hypothetical protein